MDDVAADTARKDEPAQNLSPRGYFISREDDTRICIVSSIDGSFAWLSFPTLSSSYAMPINDYNLTFGNLWRPALIGELTALFDQGGFQPPAVIPDDWADYGYGQ